MTSRLVLGKETFLGSDQEKTAEKALLGTTYKFTEIPERLAKQPWMEQSDDSDSDVSDDDDSTALDTILPPETPGIIQKQEGQSALLHS